jgi:hypothetical protein
MITWKCCYNCQHVINAHKKEFTTTWILHWSVLLFFHSTTVDNLTVNYVRIIWNVCSVCSSIHSTSTQLLWLFLSAVHILSEWTWVMVMLTFYCQSSKTLHRQKFPLSHCFPFYKVYLDLISRVLIAQEQPSSSALPPGNKWCSTHTHTHTVMQHGHAT